MLTAGQIKAVCGEVPFIYRAGAWKPRTSPHTFRGAGEEALGWLAGVKQQFGMEVATEIATPEHVQKAIAAGTDYLWIGARTSANPMAVEAIADRLCLTEYRTAPPDRVQNELPLKGIMIKNPVNEDAALWIGNIERLEKTGVPVIAVHRGCGHRPCWAMAHKVRLARPDIPMLLDPSHMSGDAARVPELMQKIEELGLDGAMVEVHHKPEEALSDAKQQIRPSDLSEFIGVHTSSSGFIRKDIELNWLRAEIDELDETLWETIAARMEVSKRIGEWKKANGVAPLQPERYKAISEKLRVMSEELGLMPEFAAQIWELIHTESLKQQN